MINEERESVFPPMKKVWVSTRNCVDTSQLKENDSHLQKDKPCAILFSFSLLPIKKFVNRSLDIIDNTGIIG